jgi:formylglycine-generating enzyme
MSSDVRPSTPGWADRLEEDAYGSFADLVLADGVASRMRWIPPGRFRMGSPDDELGHWEDEGPQHWVTLSRGFWLADAPCTQAEWLAVMGSSRCHFKGESRPEESIGWEEAQWFCKNLRERFPGLLARLPSEAEWEYACRAGTDSALNDGSALTLYEGLDPALARLGWFDLTSGGETHPVRALAPNRWGLYDMHGNVWEWCEDREGQKYIAEECIDPTGPTGESQVRVCRGGSWRDRAAHSRSAFRFGLPIFIGHFSVGFRLAAGK